MRGNPRKLSLSLWMLETQAKTKRGRGLGSEDESEIREVVRDSDISRKYDEGIAGWIGDEERYGDAAERRRRRRRGRGRVRDAEITPNSGGGKFSLISVASGYLIYRKENSETQTVGNLRKVKGR